MPSLYSLWIAVMQILLSVNSMLDGCEITETKEISACEVLRAQELTHNTHRHTHTVRRPQPTAGGRVTEEGYDTRCNVHCLDVAKGSVCAALLVCAENSVRYWSLPAEHLVRLFGALGQGSARPAFCHMHPRGAFPERC